MAEAEERAEAERLYKQQNRGRLTAALLPTVLLAFVLIGGAAVTCLGSLWIEPDGSLHTPWLLTLGLSLTLSWGVLEPLFLFLRFHRKVMKEDEKYESDRRFERAVAMEERQARIDHMNMRRVRRMGHR